MNYNPGQPHLDMTPAHDPKLGESGPLAHQGKQPLFLHLFGPWENHKCPEIAPHGAREIFATNPDLADILGRTDLDVEIC